MSALLQFSLIFLLIMFFFEILSDFLIIIQKKKQFLNLKRKKRTTHQRVVTSSNKKYMIFNLYYYVQFCFYIFKKTFSTYYFCLKSSNRFSEYYQQIDHTIQCFFSAKMGQGCPLGLFPVIPEQYPWVSGYYFWAQNQQQFQCQCKKHSCERCLSQLILCPIRLP